MRKDIQIPEVADVYIAAIQEWHEEFQWNDWNIYIINDKKEPLEMVLVVSNGSDGVKKTSTMRHGIGLVPAKSAAKIELLHSDLLSFENKFSVTYFYQNQLFEKKYVFGKNSIKISEKTALPAIDKQGVLAK